MKLSNLMLKKTSIKYLQMTKKNNLNYTKTCRDALKIMLSIKDGTHNVEHIVRVYDWSRELAKNYPEADLKVLKVAAYWHDVGRKYESKKVDNHNVKSGRIVEKYLQKKHFSNDFINKVKDAAINHSFSFSPTTIEGKILHDADKIAFFPDHTILDAYDSMEEGYETNSFNRKRLLKALKKYLENKDYLYEGLILKESKEIYKKIEKDFINTLKTLVNKE